MRLKMQENDIDIGEIIAISSKSFPKVGRRFYRRVRRTLEKLEKELEDAGEDAPKKNEIRKKMETLRKYSELIYSKRIRSLLTIAGNRIAYGKSSEKMEEFTEEEREIFDRILEFIEEKKAELIEGMKNIVPEEKPAEELFEDEENTETPGVETEEPPEKEKTDGTDAGEDGDETGKKPAFSLLRILKDSSFADFGGHNYYLKKGDVVNIDRRFAAVLLEEKSAERIEPRG